MPTSTRTKDDDTEVIEPTENVMFDREGLDRKGLRREFAGVQPIDLETLYVERDDLEYVDPRTTEMPYGPTGMGEYGGTGVDTVRIDGEDWKTFRYTSGYEMNIEDVNNPELQRQAIMEQFDFLADANFLVGVEDRNGNQLRKGMFDWLNTNIDSDRVYDAENYDGDAGDTDLSGREEDLFSYVPFEDLEFRLVDQDLTWGTLVGRKQAIRNFFRRSKETDERREGQTYWEILSDDGDTMATIENYNVIPDEMQLDVLPDGASEEPFTVDVTSELGTDEVYVLPPMEQVMDNYWRLSEMTEPEVMGPYDERGGREAVDYVWRYSHYFDPNSRYGNAPDALKIENVSALFN